MVCGFRFKAGLGLRLLILGFVEVKRLQKLGPLDYWVEDAGFESQTHLKFYEARASFCKLISCSLGRRAAKP